MEKLLTPKQVSSILKISTSTVRRLYKDGELQYLRIGHRIVRIYSSSLADYLKRKKPKKIRQIPDFEPVTVDFDELPPVGIG